MRLGQEYEVFDWFILHFTENAGMAFGMEFGGDIGKLALSIFRILAVIAIGYYLYKVTREGAENIVVVALSLVFAGALGNIVDSTFYGLIFSESYGQVATVFPEGGGYADILFGRVVDMLYFPLIEGHFPSWFITRPTTHPWWIPNFLFSLFPWANEHFLFFRPVFNIADASITVGMGIVILFQKKFLKDQ